MKLMGDVRVEVGMKMTMARVRCWGGRRTRKGEGGEGEKGIQERRKKNKEKPWKM